MEITCEPDGQNWWFKNVSTDKQTVFNFDIYLLFEKIPVSAWIQQNRYAFYRGRARLRRMVTIYLAPYGIVFSLIYSLSKTSIIGLNEIFKHEGFITSFLTEFISSMIYRIIDIGQRLFLRIPGTWEVLSWILRLWMEFKSNWADSYSLQFSIGNINSCVYRPDSRLLTHDRVENYIYIGSPWSKD